MRIPPAPARLLAVVVAASVLASCDLLTDNNLPTPPSGTNDTSTDLNSTYGGYTFTDEAVAFGDTDVQAVAALETDQPPVAASDTIPTDSTIVIRLLWGQLQRDCSVETTLDWSGSVRVSDGQLAVRHTIAFENVQDYLILPRTDRQQVDFVSLTRPSFDGLLLFVNGVSLADGAADAVNITLTTTPLTLAWSLGELLASQVVVPVDESGNAVSISAMVYPAPYCKRGFVRGEWATRDRDRTQDRDAVYGAIRAVWLGPDNGPRGHFRGHFGVNAEGEKVWFGKIIGPRGNVLGLAHGTWQDDPDAVRPGGSFTGQFDSAPGARDGEIIGRYLYGPLGPNGAGGFFEARWNAGCGSPSGRP